MLDHAIPTPTLITGLSIETRKVGLAELVLKSMGYEGLALQQMLEQVLEDQIDESKFVGTHRGNNVRQSLIQRQTGTKGTKRWHAARRAATTRKKQLFAKAKAQFIRKMNKLVRQYWGDVIDAKKLRREAVKVLRDHYLVAFRQGMETQPYRQETPTDAVADHGTQISKEDQRWVKTAWTHEQRWMPR